MHYELNKAPWIAFVLALAVYWLTVDPGASYWDCPEYLITALRLEIGHPPGNPGWALAHRFASCIFPDPAVQVRVVNMMSGLFTALSVMMLCSVSISLMRLVWKGRSPWRKAAISVASVSGSLCFAWCDSAWYSASEAEVYAMSLFLTALTVWMALKYAFSFSFAVRMRWLVAIAYVIGFSVGVHQLNLLALPAVALIMTLRSRRRVGFMRSAIAFIAGCAAVVVILKVIMPGSVALAGMADLFAVNTLGLPYWSGAAVFWILALTCVVATAVVSSGKFRSFSVSMWCLAAVMTGFSVYILIPVRACANPPVNEGNPSDIFRFSDYLSRRQYADAPLLYGRTPYSRVMRVERVTVDERGDSVYDYSWNALEMDGRDMRPMVAGARLRERSRFITDADRKMNSRVSADSVLRGYVVAGVHSKAVYTPELNMWLPRIYSGSADDIAAYGDWTGMDSASMVRVRISEALDSLGHPVAMRDAAGNTMERYAYRPSYLHSLIYMSGYQVGYMYLRYLMWNFAGRQNDISSTGEIDHGNFLTGLPVLDGLMLGPQSEMPDELCAGNRGHNMYWSVPFLLGLIGAVWLFAGKGRGLSRRAMHRVGWVSLVLFLMTGIAIVVYLNQAPGEPRERDYSFLGSFWTFSLWIAFGMLLMLRMAGRRWVRGVALLAVCAVPVWMLAENFDDHDRSGRSATFDYASNVLESLDENAILFVDGDNYIFPLWFAQEVMGVRRDVSVVCYAYLGCDWYVVQLMTPRYGHDGIAFTAPAGDVALGSCNLVRLPSYSSADTLAAVEALRRLYASEATLPVFEPRSIMMGGDSASGWVFDLLSIPGKGSGSLIGLRELATVDIIATNAASRYPRPVYWQQNIGVNKFGGFYPFTRQALFTRRLAPEAADSAVLIDECLDALPILRWGGIDRMAYPGPDVSDQAALQRASLIRLAESLHDTGRHDQALHVARLAMVRYPSSLLPYTIKTHADSAYFEGFRLADILMGSGAAEGDSMAVAEGRAIREAEEKRAEAFRRYRMSLAPGRRHALSPTSRNHTLTR